MNSIMKFLIDPCKLLLRHLDNYFFAPISPLTLSLIRVVIFGLLFWKSLSYRWDLITDWPLEFLDPIALKSLFYLIKPALLSLTILLAAFSLLGLLGLYTRWAAAICFFILYLLNTVGDGAYDSGWLLFSFLLLMICCRSEDCLSLSRIFSNKSRPLPSWEYRWSLRVMQLSFILIYLENGISKLWQSGWGWIQPEVLQGWYFFHLWTDTYHYGFGKFFLDYPQLATLSAITTLLLENGVIFIIFIERLKWIFIPGLFIMHLFVKPTLDTTQKVMLFSGVYY
jgi:hypothetical protein